MASFRQISAKIDTESYGTLKSQKTISINNTVGNIAFLNFKTYYKTAIIKLWYKHTDRPRTNEVECRVQKQILELTI